MKNLKIKKIIAVMTAVTSMMTLAACGSSDVDSTASNQSDNNVSITESAIEEEQNPAGQATSDLSTMTNGRYEIKSSPEYKEILGMDDDSYIDYSWEELKDLKMSYLHTYSGSYFFYIKCDEHDKGAYFVEITFGQHIDGIENMTVGEAVEQGYWVYSIRYIGSNLS